MKCAVDRSTIKKGLIQAVREEALKSGLFSETAPELLRAIKSREAELQANLINRKYGEEILSASFGDRNSYFIQPSARLVERYFDHYKKTNPEFKEPDEPVQDSPLFNRVTNQAQQDSKAGEIFTKVAEQLSQKFGVPYEVISPEQAVEVTATAPVKWSGEPAFAYNNKVYVLQTGMHLENAVHEYGHFFVATLAKANPGVFNKTFNDLVLTGPGSVLQAQVNRDYPEFNEQQRKEEVIVRALTDIATKKLEDPKIQNIFTRFWAALKSLLRDVFGSKSDLSKLDGNTTLDQLADMLTGENLKIETKTVSTENVINFNRDTRELISDLSKLDTEQVNKTIQDFSRIVATHLRQIMSNYNYRDIKETTTNESERNRFVVLRDNLERAKEALDDTKRIQQLGHTIAEVDYMTGLILDRLKEINTDPSVQNKLSTLAYYGYLLSDWSNYIDQFRKELSATREVPTGSELYRTVASIETNIRSAMDEITQNDESEVFDVIKEMLQPVKEEIEREYKEKLALYQADLAKGNKTAQKFIDDLNTQNKRFNLSDENIKSYLRGEMGDTNPFSGMLEAYISSPDPIIGGFSKFLKSARYEVEAKARNFSQSMRDELDPAYKKAGVSRTSVADLGKQISFVDKVLGYNEDGSTKEGTVVTLLNQFKDYRYDLDLLNYKIEQAVAKGNKDEASQLRKELRQLMGDYFHREYVDDYYKLQDIWNREVGGVPIGQIAKDSRDDLYEKINEIEDTMSNDPTTRDEQLEEIRLLRREISQLANLRDLDGELKTGQDKQVAELIREYQEKSRKFYEWVEKKGLFETRYREQQQSLIEAGHDENSFEYQKGMQDWMNENMRQVISQSFYEDRQKILDQIAAIVNSLPSSEAKRLGLDVVWKEIIAIVAGYRDQDGQPIGTDFTENQVKKIHDLQEQVEKIQKAFDRLNGLTDQEQESLSYLYELAKQRRITPEQRVLLNQLIQKGKIQGLDKIQKAKLSSLIEDLKELQSKIPTYYYLDIVNNYLSKNNEPPVTVNSADEILKVIEMDKILDKDPEFKTWFLKNHIVVNRWSKEYNENIPTYQRLYIWNRIVPNDEGYYKTTKLSDGTILRGQPSFDYFRRVVKQEYKTGYNAASKKIELKVGKHVDNKGNWLPKTLQEGAKDSKYINEDFEKLRKNSPDIANILDIYTKYHLQAQDGLYTANKLWMDVPRFRKHGLEYAQAGKLKEDVKGKFGQIISGVSSLFTKKEDDYVQGSANYSADRMERLVNADMFDNEITRVPIKGLSKIPVDQVSLDIGGSIVKYMTSAETNRKLLEINPLAKALLSTLEENGVRDLSQINKRNFLTKGIKTFIKSTKNSRLQILTNLYEREFEGIEHKLELGEFGNKAANLSMRFAAWGTLAFDIPGSIKNVAAANVQNFIESLGGHTINRQEFRKGTTRMVSEFIPNMIKDYNTLGNQSFQTQLFQMFDPVQGKFKEHIGHEFAASNLNNFFSGKWAFSPREYGEVEAQGAFWLGMMMHQRVDQTLDGETKQIQYADAFEMVNGKVTLKAGIDKEWAEGGKRFNDFKLKMHEVNQKLQGNYADIDQPELQRYTLGRLFNFMRRYLVPAAINRFSTDRIQVGVGGTREGYYVTSLRVAQNFLKNAKLNWHLYTEEEKKNVWKTVGEIAVSLSFYLLLRALGWDSHDPDKYKKLQQNSWLTNHLIYQLMAVKAESEQFIPVPGMGLDDLVRIKNTPSVAFAHFDRYYRIVGDAADYIQVGLGIEDSDILKYKSKSGYWEEGDRKATAHIARLFGFTGTTADPAVAIKNFNLVQSRTK